MIFQPILLCTSFWARSTMFHARINQGQASIGNVQLEAPAYLEVNDQDGLAYIRPHEIELLKDNTECDALRAVIENVTVIGPTVRVELKADASEHIITTELPKQHFRMLVLKLGDEVWIRPLNSKVFLKE